MLNMINLFAFLLMSFLRLQFYLRRFRIGYGRKDLVLDIGSGNDPHPRADILLDFKFEDIDRPSKLLIDERPFIIANAENLPFKDKTIDFIICSQVLEHIDNPSKAIDEIIRVGKKGYIETPSEYMQKIYDVPTHKWFIKEKDGILIFTRKRKPFYDAELATFFFQLWDNKDPYYRIWLYKFKQGIISYFWRDTIKYRVFNLPDSEIDHAAFEESLRLSAEIIRMQDKGPRHTIKQLIKFYYFLTTSRKKRLKNLSKINPKKET